MSENINLQNEEENVIVATFNIATENTTITLKNLTDMTQIDWGDGIIDSELTHTYSQIGEYTCKIYSVTSIGSSAFRNCSSLTSVEIGDSVTSIGNYAFYGCSRLTEIVIPDSVTSISASAFQGCSSLTSVVIGDGVTSVGSAAFSYCYGLTSVEIPSSVTRIGSAAFRNCTNLASVTIPDSVTSINSNAFNGCSRLTSVVIGDGITSIGGSAFYNCSRLTSVTFKSKEAIPVEMITDSRINDSTPTYYVPTGSIEVYRNAWSGTVAVEQIQSDPSELFINLEGLRTYHDTLKEKYLDFMATQDYVKEQLVGKTDYLGVVDTIPNFPNAGAGDYCRVQTEFIYDTATGETAHVGDVLIAVKDNPTQSIADWDLLHNELTSATLVTVGGVAQTSWDADTKVGFTDYANYADSGLVRGNGGNQFRYFFQNGMLYLQGATDIQIENRQTYVGLTADNIDKAVKVGITTNTETLTEDEQASARGWIGAVGSEDYATESKAGVVKTKDEFGINMAGDTLYLIPAYDGEITSQSAVNYRPLMPRHISKIVKVGVTTNTETLTDEEKASALAWLGAVAKSTEVTARQQVYVKAPNGTQEMVLLSTDFASNGIPRYDAYGKLTCADPKSAYNVVNKRFVEALITELRAEIVQDVIENGKGEIKDEITSAIITQEAGQSESLVMSQKAVTDLVADALGTGSSTEYETVDSVEEMTDTSKQYVLSSTGTIWEYTETVVDIEHNAYDPNTAMFNYRLNSSGVEKQLGGALLLPYEEVAYNGKPYNVTIKGINSLVTNYSSFLIVDYFDSAKNRLAQKTEYNVTNGTLPITINIFTTNISDIDFTKVKYVRIKLGIKPDGTNITAEDCSGLVVNFEPKNYTGTIGEWVDSGIKPSASGGGGNYATLLVKVNQNKTDIAEVSNRVTALENDSDSVTIPSFWQNAVNACIEKIKALQVGRKCITFPFFSDNHQRNGYAGMLIAHIMKECNIPYCFYGGDSISSGTIVNEAEMIAQDKAFDTAMSYIPNGRFCRAVGNHDGYWYDGTNKYWYTREKVYELFLREESIAQNKHFGGDGTYYYIDEIASKVRFIVLNTNEVDSTQLLWLQNTALSFNESGWAVVFISHQPISNHYHALISNADEVRSVVSSYINGSATNKADIVGWFSGHIHRDRIYTGVAVNTTDDSIGTAMPFRQVTITSDHTSIAYDDATKHTVANDDKSHAIDFVTINRATRTVNITRLGIGSDRSYTY